MAIIDRASVDGADSQDNDELLAALKAYENAISEMQAVLTEQVKKISNDPKLEG